MLRGDIMEMKQMKLTQEDLIEEFNAQQLSLPQIARKYRAKEAVIRRDVSRLQKRGILGYKNRAGKIIAKAGEPSPFKRGKYKKKGVKPQEEKMEPGLTELLQSVSGEVGEEKISKHHKELLVEVIHKLIC